MTSTEKNAENKQEFSFQTEIQSLLHLLSHSLYQNQEITIRELVSNASDALDKMRHVQLMDESQRDEAELVISLEPDKEARVLTIRDNGIGMTHDELIENLGTIAHSGSLAFLKELAEQKKEDQQQAVSLIGQFGVGFYSAFMLAETVEVLTRSYQGEECWRWESQGTGNFTIEALENGDEVPRGTQVRLHLKEGLDEFLEPMRLKNIIGKYSTFVPHPIQLEDEQVNAQRPIWVEPKNQLDEEQYNGFYQHLTHRVDEKPLWHLHLSSDSPFQFHALLYCPPSNFELMGFGREEHGLHLCACRILVQDNCRELLPEYLRFMHGLVDSDDLPLNVSREALQDNRVFQKISKVLVKRVLKHLETVADESPEQYAAFYSQFGMVLREGVSMDHENRESLGKLLRFKSSHTGEEATTCLTKYLERAPESQSQIYFVTGPDLPSILRNPNLEIFTRKKLEVLYLDDPVDEFVLAHLAEFNGKQITSIDAADVEFPEDEAKGDDGESEEKPTDEEVETPDGFTAVLTLFKEALEGEVEDVRESKRLTDSPCCLVNSQGAMSTQLQKILSMTNKEFEMSQRTLEINPQAPLIKRLCLLSTNAAQSEFIKQCGQQLYDNALLLEGLTPNTERGVTRMHNFLIELAEKRSPIVT